MQPWKLTRDRGYLTLELGNRYLSIEEEQGEEVDDAVLAAIDPLRLLRSRMPPGARHLSDNRVRYYTIRREGSK